MHHNTSGAESDVVFGVPSSSFQHEGESAPLLLLLLLLLLWLQLKCLVWVRVKGLCYEGEYSRGFVFSETKNGIEKGKEKWVSESISRMLFFLAHVDQGGGFYLTHVR